ncbi:translocation/assembly module TamB domain-containing protein [Deinococcus sp. YIM 77859]|uniref:translocation/assembly module TamB domain-containing protein n=1 Tax=Deinococcus sp. YIM 77859 TaxID=1540221 RepID=UPI000AE50508|nr:translocation/assembly module TamB domain-containing protein [Deinococcus sp. YIM 77859]
MTGTPRPNRFPHRPPARRWPWVILVLAALLGLAAWFAPALLGRWVLERVSGEGTRLRAEEVHGPLWAPGLREVQVELPGVSGTAKRARVSVAGVDLRHRTVRLNVALSGADVTLGLRDLLGGGGEAGGAGGWKVVLSGLDVRETRVKVDGSGVNLPNGRFRVTRGEKGTLAVRGHTPEGELQADVAVQEGAAGNRFVLDLSADARVLNHYWPGVTGGRITGRYVLGDGPVRGDLRLTGGSLRVPQARFVTVQDISGTALHRGDDITLNLVGRGWKGPVTARGGVDLQAKHWTVTAEATPTVAGLAQALGTTGTGDLRLRVTAGGWSTVRVKANGKATGRIAGVPFRDLKAEYTYLSRDATGSGAGQTNDLALSAQTALAGQQVLRGRWAFGREGWVEWTGDLAGKPLDLRGELDARNVLTLSGAGLGGSLQGSYALETRELQATLNPTYGAARARVTLSGTPGDLRAAVTEGEAGPFALAGTVRLNRDGLKADLGPVGLDLDRHFRGTWTARNLSGAGLTLSGQGTLDLTGGDVRGTVAADVPGLSETLRGPLVLNYREQYGTFTPGEQRLTWRGDTFTLEARNLAVTGGVRVNGTATVRNDLSAVGTLTATGNGFDLTATGLGDVARLRGTAGAGGVTVLAETRLTRGFPTTARVQGAEIGGVLSVGDGVRFTLSTAGETARGVLDGERWDVTGRVNLAALRPLLGVDDLTGTLDFALAGRGGTAQVNAAAAGAEVRGTLTRVGGTIRADLTGAFDGAAARLAGQVYPSVAARGSATWQGQTLNAALSGEYGNLRARLTGRTGELSFAGVTLPGQAVNLAGTLTPALSASGIWGGLNVRYDARTGLLAVSGEQVLTAFGQTGRVRGQATWAPGPDPQHFRGSVNASGVLDQYTVSLRGPWQNLNVVLTDDEGLRATGRAALPAGRYDLRVRGPVAGLYVDGRVRGTGLAPQGTVDVFDGAGGSARVTLRGFSNFDVRSRGLTLAGQALQGDLTAREGRLSGNLTAGPLRLTARDGQVNTSGEIAGHSVTATGRLVLPATLEHLRVRITGPYVTAQATGGVANLRGSVRVRAQTFGAGTARLTLPAQTFPLTASLTGARARIGDLTYSAGTWDGGLSLRYALAEQDGTLRLLGEGPRLVALPTGPVAGGVTLLPALGGTLTANLSPLLPLLPGAVRAEVVPGELVATLSPGGAMLTSRGTRYLGDPLTLNARVSWTRGFTAAGTLTHPGSRLPVRYDGRDLTVSGARLDARVLRPLVEASGTVRARLTVPGLDLGQASGQARINVTAASEPVTGTLTLTRGELGGNLRAGPLRLTARDGEVNVTGEVAGQTLSASGGLKGLSTLENLRVALSGPYLTVSAAGDAKHLNGTLRLGGLPSGAGVALPPQTLPLSASLTGGRVRVGDLTYAGGRWTGRAGLRYTLGGQPGTLGLVGEGERLTALPTGPVTGRVALRPDLEGTLTADLAPLLTALPADVRGALVPGQLRAQVDAAGATLTLRGARYLGEPLNLEGWVKWPGRVTAAAELTHPGSRIPVRYDGRDLTVQGAVLDARALGLWLEATGSVTADLTVPGLDFERADGQARVHLAASGQRAVGRVTLARGQLAADLTSDLAGLGVQVRGPLYPRANAVLNVGDVRGTLSGNAAGTLTLRAAGTYGGRSLDLTAVGRALTGPNGAATLQGAVAGASLNLNLGRAAQGWRVTGRLDAPDLHPLAGTAGNLSGTVSGTLGDLRLNASGEVAGVAFRVPATYTNGVLRVQGASATLPGALGTLRASGPVFPALSLSAKATLTDLLPGSYTAQVLGTLAKPDVRAQGTLTNAATGLQAGGTALRARLLGRDWRLNLSGEALAGYARGQLGSGAPGGVQDSRLTVHAPFLSGETRVRLDGVTGWNARSGWLGNLRASGTVPGGVLDAALTGAGSLALAGRVGSARLAGAFPADLPLRPGGTLDLTALDLGALWGRPEELRATGRAALAGTSWSRPEATFAGRLNDVGGDLTGELGATYRAGDVTVRLTGERLTGGAVLRGGRYEAQVRAEPVRLARLLPPSWNVDALTFAGTLSAAGTLAHGPERIEARRLALRGEQGAAGPFSLYGQATYLRRPGQPDVLETALAGSLRGGVLRAQGTLPAGVRVTAQDVDARGLGAGRVNGSLTLSGPLEDPRVTGAISAATEDFEAQLTLSGPLRNARAHARLSLRGEDRAGLLYADATNLNLAAGTVQARVYGTARQGGSTLRLDLSGAWPRLTGSATATLPGFPDPVTLRGDGQGSYGVSAGALGVGRLTLTPAAGFIPALSGQLRLMPLALVGGRGSAQADVTFSGTLAAPRLSGTLSTRGAEVAGVRLTDTAGTLSGTLNELRGTLTQAGQTVATLEGQTLTLNGLSANAAGSELRVTGRASLNGTADLTLAARGVLAGQVRATAQARALRLEGALAGQGLRATLDVKADPFTGWHGTARVAGGPAGVLTDAARLRFSGPFAHPLVTGEAGVLGAGARLVANADGAQLRLVDGPVASASGVLELRPDERGEWTWQGTAALSRPELSLSVTPNGPLTNPNLTLSVRRGEWRAAGTASLRAADLDVTDGLTSGRVTWNGGILRPDLPGLDLARLGLEGVSGRLTVSGSANTAAGDGRVTARATNLTTAYDVPYLGVTLAGDLAADVTLAGGRPRVQASAALPSGVLRLNAARGEGGWTGNLTGTLTREGGTLSANVISGPAGLTGGITAARYPLSALGQDVRLAGTLALRGQTFGVNLTAGNDMGEARVSGEGGLADLLPALAALGNVRPTEEGYHLRALLDNVEVAKLKVAPGLAGRVNGEANISDGGGTVVLNSPALRIGFKTLGARVEGTLVGGDWRLRGFLGETDFFASLTGGTLSGRATLQALPLGAVVAAFTGTAVGEGVVTGAARFTLPLADPLAGNATVVAERIRVTATSGTGEGAVTETLTGTGTLDYAARELRNVNIQLAGAGTWDVRGGYTRERVDLQARFTDTTFTPVLRLIPGVAELTPSLKGSVTLAAAGTYDRPRGLLRAQNLVGSVAGLSLQIPTFSGDLPDSGAFTASGRVLTGGTVGSDGTVDVKGQLTLGKLSSTRVTFTGLLAPQALGALPSTTVTLAQGAEGRWTLDAQSLSAAAPGLPAGSLRVTGTVAPRPNLTLTARGYNLPLAAISARESVLNADLRAVDDGQLVRVSGAANFLRLVLGRVDAPATIPAPGESSVTGSAASANGRTTDDYPSPLPPEYTTFPRAQAEAAAAPARPFLERIVFEDVPIQAPNGIRVDEAFARAEFSGNLTLSGTGARPVLRGDILAQRGTLFLRENEFTLQTGRVTFPGEGVLPTFAATASGTVPSATTGQRVPVTLDVRGEFRLLPNGENVLDLRTALRCTAAGSACTDPTTGQVYTEAQLYALVATGVPDLEALPANLAALGTSALQTALNVFVLGELERNVARALGLDVFRLTPNLATADGSLGATITLGSYLTRDLYLQYQVDLNGQGLLDATYSTPDGRVTFKVSTPLSGLNLDSVRPSFSAAYNLNPRTSLSLGVQNDEDSTKIRFGVTYRLFAR